MKKTSHYVSCRIRRLTILLFLSLSLLVTSNGYSQNNTEVSGKITNSEGKPLSGVSISEKKVANGTVSKDDGTFRLRVKDQNAVLLISMVGYKIVVHPLKGNLTVNVT